MRNSTTGNILLRIRKGYSKVFNNNWFRLLLLVVIVAGCKKVNEDAGLTGLCPQVVSTSPTDSAMGVAINTIVVANFNEVMDSSTITAATFTLKNGTTPIAGYVTYAGKAATFTPTTNLARNTKYTATITTGAKDRQGNALVSNYVWSFTTGDSLGTTPPTVIATDPLAGATAVPVNKKITATFSKAMNPLTINNTTFLLKHGAIAVTGVVTYAGTVATFSPTVNLDTNILYTATITTGSKDLVGNALVSNYTWSFTTVSGTSVITPPTVIATDPVNNATGVLPTKQITATFSKVMDPLTINSTTFLLKHGVTAVTGTVTYAGTVATFSPTVNLDSNTLYTATITTGAKDLAGNALVSNYVWTFTTIAPPPPDLKSAALFGAFGGNAGITNQGVNTVINNGSIGTTAASTLITGFHDGTTGDIYTETPLNIGNVTGRIYTAPPAPGTAASFAIATAGRADALAAYNSISPASKPGGTDPGAGELGNLTLTPGVYKAAATTFKITSGNLTLDAAGNPNAIWIFQCSAALTVGVAGPTGARSVILINGAQAKNVFWYVGSSATINGAGGGTMVGTIITSAGLTFSTAGNLVQTILNGRALSLNASVTMVNTTINVP
ncbi:MAG: Ig-like domain-containing protein [Taibaiella sp.]|nr:Ig-like domain-containing protein [Taibaiella sp.]